jgi:glycosyltransferase involved in cell wall biosynthesis
MTSIRGSCLKTLESLAAGRICVSTRDAARGFLTPRPPGLIVVGEVSDMVLPIVELLRNPPRRHRLEAEAHAAAERWGWRHRAAEQLSLYREARV